MSWIQGLRHRLRSILSPRAFERELQEEMRFHVELETMQSGDTHAARRRFGNRTYYQEETRRMTWLGALDGLVQDTRYAWRSLTRSPSLAVMIIVTLTLGLGVNAATFTLLDRLYLRMPSGVEDPAAVRRLWFARSAYTMADGKAWTSPSANYPMYGAIASVNRDPRSIALYLTDNALRFGEGATRTKVHGIFASASYFTVLGVRPSLGRVYTPDEDSLGHGSRVVVLSHAFWRKALGADSSVLGQQVRIELEPYTVIGVLPEAFTGLDLQHGDVWIPLASIPSRHWIVQTNGPGPWRRNPTAFQVIRREASTPDASFLDRATIAVRDANVRSTTKNPDTTMTVLDGSLIGARGPGAPGQDMVISTRLGGVAIIVLLIACANVINLLLARAEQRRREIAVRLAVGISRARLVRLLTAETVLLALVAGAAALLAAWWGGTLLRALILPDVEWRDSVLEWRVVAFALATALGAGVVAGVIPAWRASRPDLTRALKDGAKNGSAHRSRLRNSLAVVQAALSVTLLVGAVLFVRSLHNVQGLDLGYDTGRLVFAHVRFDDDARVRGVEMDARMHEIGQRLAQRPGVEAVARAGITPMRGFSFYDFFWGTDSSSSLRQDFPTFNSVTSAFFATAGLRMIRGTTFDDEPGASRGVVVNEAMAKRLWPDRNAIGQCIRFEKRENPCYTVVGIVETARQGRVIEQDVPQYYLPMRNMPSGERHGGSLVVRASAEQSTAATASILAELRRAFPTGEPVVQTMTSLLEPEYRPWRLGATLFTAMGVLALIVALVGIYSTVSYAVTQRTHEFGVRVALGARVRDVLSLVVGQGVRMALGGVLLGTALALAGGRLVSALLYGVKPSDPLALVLVSVSILAVAVVATLVPAWRAARVDPVTALRAE